MSRRPGAPRRITNAERVVAKTLESTPRAATHWSTRSMARATGLSQTAISRSWRAFGLQPHPRHRNARELERAIQEHLDVTSEEPKPFVWTKTADQILESVAAFCDRTFNSGH